MGEDFLEVGLGGVWSSGIFLVCSYIPYGMFMYCIMDEGKAGDGMEII